MTSKNAQCSSQMHTSNLQDLLRSQCLETVPVCIVWQKNPQDNFVCIHMCDEYVKSIDSGVFSLALSILRLIVQACLQIMKYQVVQFVPSISISKLCESKHVTILQQVSFLLL